MSLAIYKLTLSGDKLAEASFIRSIVRSNGWKFYSVALEYLADGPECRTSCVFEAPDDAPVLVRLQAHRVEYQNIEIVP